MAFDFESLIGTHKPRQVIRRALESSSVEQFGRTVSLTASPSRLFGHEIVIRHACDFEDFGYAKISHFPPWPIR